MSALFWKRYPALYLALALLIGIASAFHIYLLALILLIPKKQLWCISLAGILYCKLFYPSFPQSFEGALLFHIEEVKHHSGPFNSSLVYRGKVTGEEFRRIPCRLYMYREKNRPLAHCDYLIPEASLIEIAPYRYILKGKGEWIPIAKSFSLAERRFQIKEKIKKLITSHYKDSRVQDLMAALLTGNLENRILSYQFAQVGLQHLLAISGFHFALLTLFLAFLLKRFLPERAMAACLILLLTLYFFYMGSAPSISRAWIGVMIFLLGMLFSFRPSALNALGMALLAALLLDPLVVIEVGFQLSFGATLGILLFYKRFEEKLTLLLPKRPFKELRAMARLDQCGYLLLAYIRKILALNGAVLIFTLPLLLFHFQTFPLLSLVYNLFFPLLFSLMIGGLIVGFFIPGIALLNGAYAAFLLKLIANAPKRLMFHLNITEAALLCALGVILFLARLLWVKRGKRRETLRTNR
ncbi:MAG: hypothetical protein K1060chlam2_01439 [Chlamydiae bacterium]|nr:hypothetical protein [Chlamydiota bacterium]